MIFFQKNIYYKILEREMIKVVNKVGIDINMIIARPHLQSTLQFISGLGPRKAKYILQKILKLENSIILKREYLFEDILNLKKKKNEDEENNPQNDEKEEKENYVFKNCSGFLIIKFEEGLSKQKLKK